MDLFMRAQEGRLVPTDEEGLAAIRNMKAGLVFKVKVTAPRNPGHHRKLMALVGLILSASDKYFSKEDVLVELKLRTGHYKEYITSQGEIVYVPKSIAFENMEQMAFAEWYDKAITATWQHIVPMLTRHDVVSRIGHF